MRDKTVRIQISLHLDDPIQKHAFDVLNGLSRSARRQYICNLIRTNGLVTSENELAELIAQKVSEKLAEKDVRPERKSPTGKKRGRPPKTHAKTDSEGMGLSECTTKPVLQTEPQPVQARSTSPSTTPKHIVSDKTEEILPDDDMLASMSAFVGE